jgi:hypothetical protein
MEENILIPVGVIVAIVVIAFVTRRPPSASFVNNGVKTVIKNSDDLIKFADEIYYITQGGLKEAAKSKTAIPIAASSGGTLGYLLSTVDGKQIVVLDQEQDVLQAHNETPAIDSDQLQTKMNAADLSKIIIGLDSTKKRNGLLIEPTSEEDDLQLYPDTKALDLN